VQSGEGELAVQRTAQELAISLPARAVERATPVAQPVEADTLPDRPRASVAQPKPTPRPVVVESVESVKAPAELKATAITSPSKAELSAVAQAVPAKPVNSVEPVAVKVELSAREQRLLALDGGTFMLQILGSSSEQGVRDYVKQYVGRLPVSYFETEMRQKPWYVVLAGPYTSREQAEQAVLGFPQDIQKQLPWVRSVDSIQLDIRARLKR
jgi:DamX protein